MAWLELLQDDPKAQTVELLRCKDDPWYFLTHWCHTIDATDEKNPNKLFPNKKHLFIGTRVWEREKTLLVPKSRQLTATWLFCALYFWDAFFYGHRLNFFQSKKESDAAELIIRTYQIWNSLPLWMREWNHCDKTSVSMQFQNTSSRIMGIAQGAEHVRGYTLTGMFVDEGAYVLDMDKMIAAIRPAIRSGGRLTAISSAAPGYFGSLVLDTL